MLGDGIELKSRNSIGMSLLVTVVVTAGVWRRGWLRISVPILQLMALNLTIGEITKLKS